MYSLDIYSKAVIHNGIYDIAFPNQSETQNLVTVSKILDIYSLLYFRGSLRSLAALLDKCLLIDVFLFYKIFVALCVIFSQIISQKINFLCKFSIVIQILEFSG